MIRGLFQPMHLLVILVIVLIVFGPGKLPELGNSLGKAIKGFKKAVGDENHDAESAATMNQASEKK
jgi:sec-independent protein translocase protein TatA